MDLNKRAIKMIANRKNLKWISYEAIDLAVIHAGEDAKFSRVVEIFMETFDYYAANLLATKLFMIDLDAYFKSQDIHEIDTRNLQKLIAKLDMNKTVSVKEVLAK
jgi:hypothetical protein